MPPAEGCVRRGPSPEHALPGPTRSRLRFGSFCLPPRWGGIEGGVSAAREGSPPPPNLPLKREEQKEDCPPGQLRRGLRRPRARRGRSAARLCALSPPAPALQLDHARAAAAVYRDARGDGDRHAGGARVIFLPTAPLHEAARQKHGGAVQAARAAGGGGVCRGVGCGAGARGGAAGGLCAFFVWPTASLLEADRARRRSLAGTQTFHSRTLCQVCQAPALKQRKRSWA